MQKVSRQTPQMPPDKQAGTDFGDGQASGREQGGKGLGSLENLVAVMFDSDREMIEQTKS